MTVSEYALMVKQAGQVTADTAVSRGYIDGPVTLMTAARKTQTDLMRRVWNAERIAREAGGTVEVNEAGRAAEEETARWVEVTDEEIAEECDGGRSAPAASGREGGAF